MQPARRTEKTRVPEVAIYFEYNLYRGNRTRKVDAEDFEAFQSLNYPLLAEAGVSIKYNDTFIQKPENASLNLQEQLDANVSILKLFPGIHKEAINAVLNIEGLKGLILETYGSGNAPTSEWFYACLAKAIEKNIVIVNVSQCNGGTVNMGKYDSSLGLQKLGIISGGDMTTESAITKLMYLFGKGYDVDKVKIEFEKNLRGERTTAIN